MQPLAEIPVFVEAAGADYGRHWVHADWTLPAEDTWVHFTVVNVFEESLNLTGVGVARVDLEGSKVESLAHGIGGQLGVEPGDGQPGGPHRVYLQGDTMYLVTSFAIAAVKKSALDDRSEFAP